MEWIKKLLEKPHFPKLIKKNNLVPRSPRIQLLDLHHIHFRSSEPPIAQDIPLVNISTSGVGLLKHVLPSWPPKGTLLKGEFHFEGKTYPVEMKLVHTTHEVVGCAFQGDGSALHSLVQRYFDVELTALKMTEVKPELLQAEPDGQPHWFHGQDNCELYFVTRDKHLLRFTLTFFANTIEGGTNLPTRFGKITGGEATANKPYSHEPNAVHWDPSLAKELETPAIKFIRNLMQLTVEQKTALISLIKRGQA